MEGVLAGMKVESTGMEAGLAEIKAMPGRLMLITKACAEGRDGSMLAAF
ncbi:MAG: hypothetical protein WCF57_04375 [Pyrinomonadaceae bacterium]